MPDKVKMDGVLARIDYDNPDAPTLEEIVECGCPAGGIMSEKARWEAARKMVSGGEK